MDSRFWKRGGGNIVGDARGWLRHFSLMVDRRKRLLIWMVALALLAVCVGWADSPGVTATSDQGPFPLKLSSRHIAELDAGIESLRKAFPMTEQEKAEFRDVVIGLRPYNWSSYDSKTQSLLRARYGGLPILAELLSSHDEAVRLRAAFALRCVFRSSEEKPPDQVEEPTWLILERSLLDKSAAMRKETLSLVWQMRRQNRWTLPDELIILIRLLAARDRDETVRMEAYDTLSDLALAPIRYGREVIRD